MKIARPDVRFHWGQIHRPRLLWTWMDRRTLLVGVSWGDAYSDPVWSVDLTVELRGAGL